MKIKMNEVDRTPSSKGSTGRLNLQMFFVNNILFAEKKLKEKPYSLRIEESDHYQLFKYNQINSDFHEPIVRESRGIILDKKSKDIVCRPFPKFFNYGEALAVDIDWEHATVGEKLDGSLIKVWCGPKDGWHVSTNGTIDAHSAGLEMAFKPENSLEEIADFFDLFVYSFVVTANKGAKDYEYRKDDTEAMFHLFDQFLNKEYTYLFELCTPMNRVVVPHSDYKVYFITAIENKTGNECLFEDNPLLNEIPRPHVYPLTTLDACIAAAGLLPFREEGYVVSDVHCNRLKVKSPAYTAVHHLKGETGLKGSLTPRRVLDLIRLNEESEFLSYFPEFTKVFVDMREKYDKYCEAVINDVKNVYKMKEEGVFEDRKSMAEYINQQCTNPGVCFKVIDNKVDSPIAGIDKISSDNLIKLL